MYPFSFRWNCVLQRVMSSFSVISVFFILEVRDILFSKVSNYHDRTCINSAHTLVTCFSFVFHFSLISTILTQAFPNDDVFDVKALRAFRVIRPIRLVSRAPSKYTIMNCQRNVTFCSGKVEKPSWPSWSTCFYFLVLVILSVWKHKVM